ncbi:hypothetical protein KC347_g274 [Hortaea werneckii]|nr:hypothetical protein KC347_g274 [Hortaea werneckii]
MADAGGRNGTYYVPYLYRTAVSTRPKELLGLSPSPLSHHIVDIFLVGIAFQEIPSVHTTARLRPLPAERISPLLKGETTTCKTSSSLFELFHRLASDTAPLQQQQQQQQQQGVFTHPAIHIHQTSYTIDTAASKMHIADTSSTVTRTHKGNDRDHVGLANGTAVPEEHLPRYFGKAGFAGTNPAETKKKGSGKGNCLHTASTSSAQVETSRANLPSNSRGQAGISELEDYDYNSLKPRRRSNSMSLAAGHSALKTKFEAVDEDAIEFDEALHGPRDEDLVDNHLEKMNGRCCCGAEEVSRLDAKRFNEMAFDVFLTLRNDDAEHDGENPN